MKTVIFKKSKLGIERKHSRGPWTAAHVVILDPDGNRVAECPPYGSGFVSHDQSAPWHSAAANARLVAVGPEMFDVLAKLQADLDIYQTEDVRHLTVERVESHLAEIGAIFAKL